MKTAFTTFLCLVALSACAYIPVSDIHFKNAVFSKEIEKGIIQTPKGVTKEYSIDDSAVNVFVTVNWDKTDQRAGLKSIRWEWYTGDKLVSQVVATFNFYNTPFTLIGSIPIMNLGIGVHHVKLYIEDKEITDQVFEIKPTT